MSLAISDQAIKNYNKLYAQYHGNFGGQLGLILWDGCTFGVKARGNAEDLIRYAQVLFEQNKELGNGTPNGLSAREIKELNRLYGLYTKNEVSKLIDGIGNLFFFGHFGRKDSADAGELVERLMIENKRLIQERTVANIADQAAELEQEVNRLRANLANAPNQQELLEENRRLNGRINELERINNELAAQNNELTGRIDALQQENNDLRGQIENLTVRYNNLTQFIHRIAAHVGLDGQLPANVEQQR